METKDGCLWGKSNKNSPVSPNYEKTNDVSESFQYPRISRPAKEDTYKNNNPASGIALIFNHKKIKGLEVRGGVELDTIRLKQVLTAFGFEVRIYRDKDYASINKILKEVANEQHDNYDCFCVILSSHGEKGEIFAADLKYPVNRLWEPFLANNCKSLINKPKLFFIQACRGDKIDKGVQFTTMSRASPSSQSQSTTYVIPTHADLLVMFSSFEDYVSFKNESYGSWLLQSLCIELEKVLKNQEQIELYKLLTAVNRRVANEYESYCPDDEEFDQAKEMPTILSTLTKTFYLKPKSLN